ncbi:UDP-glucuronosyltransferase 2B10-like [Orbicella faveolata]|uniref:UDP-glucuronosyltransferase 2B10-like n=1 Tax=Orbicella faveolata TaxID=48498 RepID=UPI0009E36A2D|nr:UDP-glucuronosyltransferase 2B10-like [Orbicella faveolata]
MWITVILIYIAIPLISGAKILGVLMTESKSHYSNLRNVADEMASRGYEVTLVVPSTISFPASISVQHLVYKYPFDEKHVEKTLVPMSHSRSLSEIVDDHKMWMDFFITSCRALITYVKLHREELSKFDLMFRDTPPECGAIVSEMLGIPRIDIRPGMVMRLYKDISVVSYIPDMFSSNSDRMSFVERVVNLISHTLTWVTIYQYYARFDELRKEFGVQEQRSFEDSLNNVEVVIITGHFALEYPQPILPATKLVGPLTVKTPSPLPRDLEQFIIGAGDKGIILFSLGTLGDEVLQKHQVEMLAEAFGRLEQRIIWRLNGHVPKGLPPNVKVLPWIPQNDLLAHNRTKAFISHAGHNSLYEAAFYGVPMICMPLFLDQFSNCAQARSVGMAVGVDIKTVTGDEVYQSIRRIIQEPSFKGNATRISRLLRDNPRTSVQQAADWIEYVHRHKGAKHLRPEVYNLHWYQYYLLDVLAFLLTTLFAFCIAITMLFKLLSKIVTKRAKGDKISKQE